MKKFTNLLIAVLVSVYSFSQTPGTFNYQAVIRDASGTVLSNQEVVLTISIVQGSEEGTEVYTEEWNVETNAFGLVNIQIGSKNLDDFAVINWEEGPFYLALSVDGEYLGTSPMLSVPFAKVAQRAIEGDADSDPTNELQDISLSGNQLSISGGSTVSLPLGTEHQTLSANGFELSISGGNTILLPIDSAIQSLSLSGHDLTISGGNTITIPDAVDDADADPTNELELPQQLTYYGGRVLKANGFGGVSWERDADSQLTEQQVDNYVSNNGYQLAVNDGDTDATNELELPTQTTGDANKVLAADGSGGVSWQNGTVDTKLSETEVDAYVANNGYADSTQFRGLIATNAQAIKDTASQIRADFPDAGDINAAEIDPVYSASQAANITSTDITNLGNLSGTNSGDQDLSALATKTALADSTAQVRSEIPDAGDINAAEIDPVYSASQAANITSTDITNLGNLSGTNSGDQDLSALATKTALADSTAQVRSEIPDVSGFQLSADDGDTDDTNEIELPAQTGNSGKYLATNGTSPSWISLPANVWSLNSTNAYYNGGSVGIGTDTPNSSAILELNSSTKGFLPPRLTSEQRDAISGITPG